MAIASPRGRRLAAVTGALLAVGAPVAGCGGGGEDRATVTGPVVDMADIRFDPPRLAVAAGDTVTFRNVGKLTHNAKGEAFFSRVVEPGGSYSHTFEEPGRFEFVCTFHPGMEGTITVR